MRGGLGLACGPTFGDAWEVGTAFLGVAVLSAAKPGAQVLWHAGQACLAILSHHTTAPCATVAPRPTAHLCALLRAQPHQRRHLAVRAVALNLGAGRGGGARMRGTAEQQTICIALAAGRMRSNHLSRALWQAPQHGWQAAPLPPPRGRTWWKCAQKRMTVVVRPTSVDRPRIILLNTAWGPGGGQRGGRGMRGGRAEALPQSRWVPNVGTRMQVARVVVQPTPPAATSHPTPTQPHPAKPAPHLRGRDLRKVEGAGGQRAKGQEAQRLAQPQVAPPAQVEEEGEPGVQAGQVDDTLEWLPSWRAGAATAPRSCSRAPRQAQDAVLLLQFATPCAARPAPLYCSLPPEGRPLVDVAHGDGGIQHLRSQRVALRESGSSQRGAFEREPGAAEDRHAGRFGAGVCRSAAAASQRANSRARWASVNQHQHQHQRRLQQLRPMPCAAPHRRLQQPEEQAAARQQQRGGQGKHEASVAAQQRHHALRLVGAVHARHAVKHVVAAGGGGAGRVGFVRVAQADLGDVALLAWFDSPWVWEPSVMVM